MAEAISPPAPPSARLLAAERGVLHRFDQPCLTEEQILAWADYHHERTGSWPKRDRNVIAGTQPEETWEKVDIALRRGTRGLHGGSSLPLAQ